MLQAFYLRLNLLWLLVALLSARNEQRDAAQVLAVGEAPHEVRAKPPRRRAAVQESHVGLRLRPRSHLVTFVGVAGLPIERVGDISTVRGVVLKALLPPYAKFKCEDESCVRNTAMASWRSLRLPLRTEIS